MTLDTFMELVNGGYITEVGKIDYYKKHPEILEQKTIRDLSLEGTICKYVSFESGELQTFIDEETDKEVMTIVDSNPTNDENVILSVTPKNEEVVDTEDKNDTVTDDEIVVDDETTDKPSIDSEE